MSADAGVIVVCNAIFRLQYLVPFWRYSRSKYEVVRTRAKKACFSAPNFLGGEDPQILDLVFKIAPISDHVAKLRGDRPRDCRDLALNKERKKETAAKHKVSRIALSQRAALITINVQPVTFRKM